MTRRAHAILALALALALAPSANAATWRIEKDGSGDFTVIQSAMSVAAPGDTIRIGPGRFAETFPYGLPSWQRQVCVILPFADLTFIGAGAKATVLGNTEAPSIHAPDIGIGAYTPMGAGTLRIRDIGFDTFYYGFEIEALAGVEVDHCRFTGCETSVDVRGIGQTTITGSDFATSADASFTCHVRAHGPGKLLVDGTIFESRRLVMNAHNHVRATQMAGTEIQASNFTAGSIGVYVEGMGGEADIRGCTLDGQYLYGILHDARGGLVRASDTRLVGQYTALASHARDARWAVDGITVEAPAICSLAYSYPMTGHIRDSRLAKGYRLAVDGWFPAEDQPPATFDMRYNWWGTSEPDSIAAWIVDGRDVPAGDFFIEWDPVRATPVATRTRSLGGMKALFR